MIMKYLFEFNVNKLFYEALERFSNIICFPSKLNTFSGHHVKPSKYSFAFINVYLVNLNK